MQPPPAPEPRHPSGAHRRTAWMPGKPVARLADERGLTLVEMLIAMAIGVALLVPTVLLITTAQNHAAGQITRSETIQQATIALRQMDNELRQAYEIEYPTAANDSSPSCPEGTTGAAAGVQDCNVVDVLVRLSNTGFSGQDFEVRYDCSIASTTLAGDRACWRYLCGASASTSSSSACTANSTALLSSRLVVDGLVNGTSADPVFAFCYPPTTTGSACATGASRPTSTAVTLKLPSTATQATANGGDPAVINLTDGVYFPNLDLGQ